MRLFDAIVAVIVLCTASFTVGIWVNIASSSSAGEVRSSALSFSKPPKPGAKVPWQAIDLLGTVSSASLQTDCSLVFAGSCTECSLSGIEQMKGESRGLPILFVFEANRDLLKLNTRARQFHESVCFGADPSGILREWFGGGFSMPVVRIKKARVEAVQKTGETFNQFLERAA